MATFKKLLDGTWGLSGLNLVSGAVVVVSKRDGSSSKETVGQVVKRFADGTTFARLGPKPQVAQAPAVVDMTSVIEFLKAAQARGLKSPKLRVLAPSGGELLLSITKKGVAPGSIAVKLNYDFIGVVRPDGTVVGRNLTNDIQIRLLQVAADPQAAAKAYAAVACKCCFCGKKLEDDGSVEVGYGPVCAKHWGLPHKALGVRKLDTAPVATAAVDDDDDDDDDLFAVKFEEEITELLK